jgi:transposase InsO family protein
MANGFIYLLAIMDWHSRQIVSWRVSKTMEPSFGINALEKTITAMVHLIFSIQTYSSVYPQRLHSMPQG